MFHLIVKMFHLRKLSYIRFLRMSVANGAAKSDGVATLKAEWSDLNCVPERSEVRA